MRSTKKAGLTVTVLIKGMFPKSVTRNTGLIYGVHRQMIRRSRPTSS